MAKLILKSPYLKPGAGGDKYLHYIGTREGVEKLAENVSGTAVSQNNKTKAGEKNASQPRNCYLQYMATRPGTEKFGTHGLFGDTDGIDLNAAMAEVSHCPGNLWTHIVSLTREDAERLGYDHADAWKHLIRAHRNDIAAAMKIAPDDFRWYAAYHDTADHPHIHLMAWSAKGDGYLTKVGIEKIKSKLTNDIFRQEMYHLYEDKSLARDELVQESCRTMQKLADQLRQNGGADDTNIAEKLLLLAEKMKTVTGKKQYGYLPKLIKKLVDDVVEELAKQPQVVACYDQWWNLQTQLNEFYSDKPMEREPLSQQKEFKSIRNAVVREAVKMTNNWPAANPASTVQQPQNRETPSHSSSVLPAISRLLDQLAKLFEDAPPRQPARFQMDRKRRRALVEKRRALGLAEDDIQEEYDGLGPSLSL